MKKISCLLILITLFACSQEDKEEVVVQPIQKNKLELSFNGKKVEENDIDVNAYYICNRQLHINVTSKKGIITSDLFTMILTDEGELEFAKFVDKSNQFEQPYQTADFIPSSTLKIDEFVFIENKLLKIKFSGALLKRIESLSSNVISKSSSGVITITDFGKSECSTFNDYIYLNNQIAFHHITKSSQATKPNPTVSYSSNSLNGFNIQFKNFTKSFADMPLGTYIFDSSSSTEKIEFREYIGNPKVFYTLYDLPTDWKLYQSAGSFTILEKRQTNGKTIVKLKLNFKASYNGFVKFNFTDAICETSF